jgi:hypothetical protein
MTARRVRGLVLLLFLVGGLASSPAGAVVEETWLIGRWELVHSPDGDPKDWLEFGPDGAMTSIAPDGRRTGGRYVTNGREIQLNFKVGSKSVIMTLSYGPDRQRLYARSARTGNTAIYEKRP